MSTTARWIPRRMLLPELWPWRLRCRGASAGIIPAPWPRCICGYKLHPAAAPTKQSKIQARQIIEIWERWMFHSSFHLEGEAIRGRATYSKGEFFFPKCASLFLICLHFLYCIYHICNFHQGKTNHSLTAFFQKCWETDEYIVLTHLLNMNSGRAGQVHKLFLCPVFKHVLALTDMGRTLPQSLKKYRLKSCQCHVWTLESWERHQHLPKLCVISERFRDNNNNWAAAS